MGRAAVGEDQASCPPADDLSHCRLDRRAAGTWRPCPLSPSTHVRGVLTALLTLAGGDDRIEGGGSAATVDKALRRRLPLPCGDQLADERRRPWRLRVESGVVRVRHVCAGGACVACPRVCVLSPDDVQLTILCDACALSCVGCRCRCACRAVLRVNRRTSSAPKNSAGRETYAYLSLVSPAAAPLALPQLSPRAPPCATRHTAHERPRLDH